jgi:hypothetical protein
MFYKAATFVAIIQTISMNVRNLVNFACISVEHGSIGPHREPQALPRFRVSSVLSVYLYFVLYQHFPPMVYFGLTELQAQPPYPLLTGDHFTVLLVTTELSPGIAEPPWGHMVVSSGNGGCTCC